VSRFKLGRETPKNWHFESADRTFGTDAPGVRTAAGASGIDAPIPITPRPF